MSSQKRRPSKTVSSEKRKKYLSCLKKAENIQLLESQDERLDALESVLDKYLLLSEAADKLVEPSSSNNDGVVVSTDERYLMALVSKSSNEAFNRILNDFTIVPSKFSIVDFADKLQPKEGQIYFDWEKYEIFCYSAFRTAPGLSSVWNGLDLSALELKERAAKRQRLTKKADQEPTKKVVPNSVVNEESKKSEEYRQLNKSLRKSFELNRQRPVNFFKLVVDKNSYPATVENIFNSSFLIREDMANLSIRDDGMPMVEPIENKRELKKSQNKQECSQMVLSFDFEKWKKIVKCLQEEEDEEEERQ